MRRSDCFSRGNIPNESGCIRYFLKGSTQQLQTGVSRRFGRKVETNEQDSASLQRHNSETLLEHDCLIVGRLFLAGRARLYVCCCDAQVRFLVSRGVFLFIFLFCDWFISTSASFDAGLSHALSVFEARSVFLVVCRFPQISLPRYPGKHRFFFVFFCRLFSLDYLL